MHNRTGLTLLAGAALVALTGAAPDPRTRSLDSFLAATHLDPKSPAEFAAACDAYLARASAIRADLEKESGPARIETTFRKFDNLALVLGSASGDAGVVTQTNLDPATRDAARSCSQKIDALGTEISLSKPIYARLKAIDPKGAAADTRFVLDRAIGQYERAGVGEDDSTRAKIKALQDRISENSIAFERNIADGRKEVTATPAELAGLPADYVAAHRPGPDGKVRITTDYPDLGPVMSYASDEGLRRRLFEANLQRAWPANDELLRKVFADRAELAALLGRPNYATLITEDKMIGSPANASKFLDEIAGVVDAPAKRDLGKMLARLKAIDPSAKTVPAWSTGYLSQLIRKEQYAVDPQEVRQYFAYDNVRDGILKLTQDLFGVQIRKWDTPLWAPGVEAYEMVEGGKVIGRFYMDNHPREGKYTHANVIPIRAGLTGRHLPVGILVCNFPAGDHKTGLMEHRDVETFLHEFGHLLHLVFAGRQQWAQQGPFGLEWDFVEAPSQMLENWVWDYDTLKSFAVDAKGEPIPKTLVERMNRARGFTEAFGDARQLGLSSASLAYHLSPPGEADLSGIYRAAYDRYSPIPMPEGLHPQASFGHLTGYSAIYYTYMWSKTISTDLFTRFEREGLRNPATARRYRQMVLAPGSSKPAATLVSDFLGRPLSLDAYKARLARGE
ncbi:MAG TPA: M3 family metallopeptidase [Allosphingosinicella sp.]|jgi:thimet oligopeptidase|nr:M3 family metallopeptidase [Allosphingosinicella sp.]